MPDPLAMEDEIASLAALYLDDELDAAGCARLNSLLSGSADAVRRFNDHCLHARTLAQSLSGRAAITPGVPRSASMPQRTVAPRSPRSSLVLPVIVGSLAAALLITAVSVAIYLGVTVGQPADPQPVVPVATLIETTDGATVIFGDDVAFEGQDYAPGLVSIEKGAAQFQLTSGASITMRGKTSMVVRSDKLATLEFGAVDFYCPPTAVGFTVQLPGGLRVVDLGTAFTIEVDDETAHIGVTEGRVRLVRENSEGEQVIAEMTESTRIRIDDAGRSVGPLEAVLEPDAYEYVGPYLPGPNAERSDPNHTKLTDGRIGSGVFTHDAWIGVIDPTLDGDDGVGQPSVVFDLGEPRRVHSVKITYLVDHDGGIGAPDRADLTFGDDPTALGHAVDDSGFDDSNHPAPGGRGNVRERVIRFEPRTARYLRLDLLNDTEWTFICEVELAGPASAREAALHPSESEQPDIDFEKTD